MQLDSGRILSTRVTIAHDDLQVGTRFREGFERIGQHAGAVVDLFAPKNRFFTVTAIAEFLPNRYG